MANHGTGEYVTELYQAQNDMLTNLRYTRAQKVGDIYHFSYFLLLGSPLDGHLGSILVRKTDHE